MVAKIFFANATRAVQVVQFVPLALFLSLAAQESKAAETASSALGLEWQSYITQELQIAVGITPSEQAKQNFYGGGLAGAIRSAFQREISTALKLSERDSIRVELRDGSTGLYDTPGLGLVRQSYGYSTGHQVSPTFVRQFGNGEIQLGGIFTYESFSTAGFGSTQHPTSSKTEVSGGSALLVGWRGAMSENLSAFASLQSRMHMDEFRSFRGLFAEPGRFDMPGRVRAGVNYQLAPQSAVGFSVERVDYSSVKPFASRLLPDRFVSLLGDSASPTFAWQDLTIYRVGFDQKLDSRSLLSLSLSSTLQPDPTSVRLQRALASGATDYTVSLGYERSFSQAARLRLGASYLPFSYFFGPSLLSAEKDYSGAHVEAEALFEVSF
jgi:hypothetical protein